MEAQLKADWEDFKSTLKGTKAMSTSLPDGTLKQIRKPARDPLIIQMERAYRESRQYELDKLLRKQSLYRRRLTLAQAGLENTQQAIYNFLHGLAESRLSERSPE